MKRMRLIVKQVVRQIKKMFQWWNTMPVTAHQEHWTCEDSYLSSFGQQNVRKLPPSA